MSFSHVCPNLVQEKENEMDSRSPVAYKYKEEDFHKYYTKNLF